MIIGKLIEKYIERIDNLKSFFKKECPYPYNETKIIFYNSIEAIKINVCDNFAGNSNDIYLIKNDKYFYELFNPSPEYDNALFNKIISTLKFIK